MRDVQLAKEAGSSCSNLLEKRMSLKSLFPWQRSGGIGPDTRLGRSPSACGISPLKSFSIKLKSVNSFRLYKSDGIVPKQILKVRHVPNVLWQSPGEIRFGNIQVFQIQQQRKFRRNPTGKGIEDVQELELGNPSSKVRKLKNGGGESPNKAVATQIQMDQAGQVLDFRGNIAREITLRQIQGSDFS
uniref:Uncharacterized protein n=1 Tax=Cucumis melo TaxID=3656 RepID=A0A9I9EEW1_CUCME